VDNTNGGSMHLGGPSICLHVLSNWRIGLFGRLKALFEVVVTFLLLGFFLRYTLRSSSCTLGLALGFLCNALLFGVNSFPCNALPLGFFSC